MVLSIVTKRILVGNARPGNLRATGIPGIPGSSGNLRAFSTHNSSYKQYGHSKSANDSSAAQTFPTPGGSVTSSSFASYNYDPSSFDRFNGFKVAVAFQAKNREKSNMFLRSKEKSPAELSPTGEDSLFVSEPKNHGHVALGVADGVGGWAEAGYDSSAISRELCHSAKEIFEASGDVSAITPAELLEKAFDHVTKSPKVEIGGTTACWGILSPDRQLKVANLGDSWCGVFRDFKLVEETHFQTHNFNTPFQLAKIPQSILHAAEREGKRYIIDTPKQCDSYQWQLQKGDIVVFATDGVTDNVVPQDTEVFMRDQHEKGILLDKVASNYVSEVVKVSRDQNFPSAFAQELSRLTGQRYLGGKEDDITVVMVEIR